ncbi:sterol desaturase family protein [Maribacter halichondriae]|uniref:sterol desaturase family protein n=1 Tax=Maribacter halichondriae TaxID=2980554 RepID=UPI002359C1C1|nr:sterol desaturase family protein [Maribacter sp. Hal144]
MKNYLEAFIDSFIGTLQWTWRSIIFEVPWYTNYFWGLILISLIVWGLEIAFPWRKNQSIFRKDFWLDAFYMFFNFFIFAIFISGFYRLLEIFFSDVGISKSSLTLLNMGDWPGWLQLTVFFVLLDFVQWFTHILLHRYEFLWRFHSVHHSVKEMGFAAHLRYHWMENILYKPLKILGVMVIGGFEPEQAYIVHFVAIAIGHLNHSNIKITWGPLKYIFNNPVMHLYHHAYTLPKGSKGVNFGISLSLWDYLFRTNYIPEDSGTISLGFPGDEKIPKSFLGQMSFGFKKSNQKTDINPQS